MHTFVCWQAGAAEKGVPLYKHIADLAGNKKLVRMEVWASQCFALFYVLGIPPLVMQAGSQVSVPDDCSAHSFISLLSDTLVRCQPFPIFKLPRANRCPDPACAVVQHY